MLKSTFKKVSAIAIAGTMLAGMMAVPANAMSEIMEDYQKTVWSQDFTNIEATEKEHIWPSNTEDVTDEVFVAGKMKYSAAVWANATMEVTDEKKLVIIQGNAANAHLLSVFPASPVALTAGKKSNINFDFCMSGITKYDETTKTDKRKGLNRSIGVNSNGLTGNTDLLTFSSTDYDKIDTVALTFVGSSDKTNIDPGTTYNFNIEIDRGANTRTLTIKNGETVVKTITATKTEDIASINDVYFKFGGYTRGHTTTVDNINITTGAERGTGEFTSDLSNVLLDENFDNFTGSVTKQGALTGTKFDLVYSWGSNPITVAPTTGGAAHITGGASAEHFIRANFEDVTLDAKDEIRVSYDKIGTTSPITSYLSMTGTAKPAIKLTAVENANLSGTGAIDHLQDRDYKIRPGVIQVEPTQMIDKNTLYHVEYIIKISDPKYGNRQTVTVKVADDNGQVLNYKGEPDVAFSHTYYLDANNETTEEDKFTSLSAFTFREYWSAPDATIDNVKVEVIKPGFEVVDVNNSTNTYTFSGTAPIKLNYVTNASAASKVIVAQYDNTKRLIKAEPADVADSGRGTVTVTPVEGAQTIKLMVLDMSTAAPYAKVFKLTKSN